jgi:hypothetical protein
VRKIRVGRTILVAALVGGSAACAGAPGPGDAGYTYNVDGRYTGRLVVGDQPFEAVLDVRTSRGGRVAGDFTVRAPLEIEGAVAGTVVDDLVRLTVTYESAGPGGTPACRGRIEGILTVAAGGDTVEGPVTVSDCGDVLAGRMSFRRP